MACLQLWLVQPEFWSSLASQASQRDKFQGQHRSFTENKVDSDWIKQLKLISALAYTPNFKRIHYNYSPSLPPWREPAVTTVPTHWTIGDTQTYRGSWNTGSQQMRVPRDRELHSDPFILMETYRLRRWQNPDTVHVGSKNSFHRDRAKLTVKLSKWYNKYCL